MQDETTKSIVAELGVTDLPPEEQEELVLEFGELALKAATLAVAEKLSGDKLDEFIALSEASDPTALDSFLDREVPDHEALTKAAVAEELKRFKEPEAA